MVMQTILSSGRHVHQCYGNKCAGADQVTRNHRNLPEAREIWWPKLSYKGTRAIAGAAHTPNNRIATASLIDVKVAGQTHTENRLFGPASFVALSSRSSVQELVDVPPVVTKG